MRKFNPYFFLVVCITMLLSACEQDALVDPPPFEKKPAIMCLMTPQSNYIEASVAYTKPYYGLQREETEFISDATLVITEDETGIRDTMYNYAPGMYSLETTRIQLKEKHVYTLLVKMANGEQYSAKSTVPPKADANKFKIESVKMGKPYEEIENGSWGYYTLNPYLIEFSYDLNDDDFYVSPQLEGSAKNTLGEEISVRISFADEILQGENNKKTSFITQSEFYSGFGIEGPFTINDFFGAVYTMDKAYRDYYKMQLLQEADNPFSEPVMFTNSFSGGAIGVFGSYDFVQGQFKYTP